MEQNLIFIDLRANLANFYNIKIEKNNDVYYLIVSQGKMGNKGTTTIAYKGNDYSYCKNEFWKRVNDKKVQKYVKMNDVIDKINKLFGIKVDNFCCDICNKELSERLYNKIDVYLRTETDVDKDKSHVLRNKVACFECQMKSGVYKGKNTEK